MTSQTVRASSIVGDVILDEVNVNQKGGSLTATLKKTIRNGLSVAAGHLDGALLQFEEGVACVLMASSITQDDHNEPHRFRVTRVSPQRFVVDLVDEQAPTVDPVTQAVLLLLQEQIKEGAVRFLEPPSQKRCLSNCERSLRSRKVA